MSLLNHTYPQVSTIEELIETNSYVRSEYEKYLKHMRLLAEKILNECIGTDVDWVCERMIKCGCGVEPHDDDDIDVKSFWKDGREIESRVYSTNTTICYAKIEEIYFSDQIDYLKCAIDDYRNFILNGSKDYDNNVIDESGVQPNLLLMNFDDLFEELETIRTRDSVPFTNMSVNETILGRYSISKEFIARFSLHFDTALYEILGSYIDVISESFEQKQADIVKEILKTDNEKYTIRIDDLRREIASFKIVYKDLLDTFIDDVMRDVNVTCTVFHFAKWYVDSEIWVNDI